MITQRTITFTTTPSNNRSAAGDIRYQGHLVHNRVLNVEDTRNGFDRRYPLLAGMSGCFFDALGSYMRGLVAEGYRADFGPFSLGLRLRGGFESANAPFDDKAHAIGVELMPGVPLKKAVKALRPVNETFDTKWRVTGVYQETPPRMSNAITASHASRDVIAGGVFPCVDTTQTDEGAWVEDDAGVTRLTANIVKASMNYLKFKLDGAIDPGNYWFVVVSRQNGNLVRATRRLAAV